MEKPENKKRSILIEVIIITIASVSAGLLYLITAPIILAPGIQYRLFAFVTPALGIILGKYRGGICAAIAEGIWALLSFYMLGLPVLSIATPFALFGDFLQAYIPAIIVEKLGEDKGISITWRNLGVILLGATCGMVALSVWFGIFFHILSVDTFLNIFVLLWLSDFLPMIIGTAPFVWLLIKVPRIRNAWENGW